LCHPIKIVAKRTGLTPHVIRVWEKRYATVSPTRSEGNQRLYSDADINRLILLRRVVSAGHSIGTVARLAENQLEGLVQPPPEPTHSEATATANSAAISIVSPSVSVAGSLAEAAFQATVQMDGAALERVLDEASITLGQIGLLNQIVAPLVHRIGDAWRRGELKVANEHLATAVIRTFLGRAARPLAMHHSAPAILVTTPAGQLHELGAILVAACAAAQGWRVLFLGASLPAEEIVGAVRLGGVRAVALSLVHPEDDPAIPHELARLRRLLPDEVAILAGGRACHAYQLALQAIRATVCSNLIDLGSALDQLRQGQN
jgi:DNA-binding transcriptional MerR regulator/methylmalonyl-CoA mutase cobalamin-binding subunit